MPVGVVHRHDVHLHLAEASGERHLRGRRQVERREQQHLVAKERGVKRGERGVVERLRDVEAFDARTEVGAEGTNGEGRGAGGARRLGRERGHGGFLRAGRCSRCRSVP
jgi:hypothetical protein